MLLDILRCPATGQPLTLSDGRLITPDGARRYSLRKGIPILIADDRSLFAGAGTSGARVSSGSHVRSALRRRLTATPVSRENFEHLAALVRNGWRETDAPRRVLVVGGGILGFGVDALLDKPWIDLVETDVYIGPRTRVVCDGHDLPFDDGVFEGVVCQAVMEHVADPQRLVQELHRVLRRGGVIYSEVPFMQQIHEGAYDFTRWTITGHRRLLRSFDEIDSGAVGGPGEALAWSLRYFALSFTGESTTIRSLVGGAANLASLPLRWLDPFVAKRPAALDAASGTYVLGRRRSTPRSDAEIVAAYRGAGASPFRCG